MKVLVCAPYHIMTNYNDGIEEFEFFGSETIKKSKKPLTRLYGIKQGISLPKTSLRKPSRVAMPL